MIFNGLKFHCKGPLIWGNIRYLGSLTPTTALPHPLITLPTLSLLSSLHTYHHTLFTTRHHISHTTLASPSVPHHTALFIHISSSHPSSFIIHSFIRTSSQSLSHPCTLIITLLASLPCTLPCTKLLAFPHHLHITPMPSNLPWPITPISLYTLYRVVYHILYTISDIPYPIYLCHTTIEYTIVYLYRVVLYPYTYPIYH